MGFSISLPTIGQPNSTEDVKVNNSLTAISAWGNGNILGSDLSSSAAIAVSQIATGWGKLAVRTTAVGITANVGDLVVVTAGSPVITLPTAAPNAVVGVFNNMTNSTTTIARGGSSVIVAAGGLGSTSFLLGGTDTSVVLQSDGTNWFVMSGQQDSGWVAMTLPGSWAAGAGQYVPASRIVGDRVWLRGAAQNNTGGAASLAVTLAAAFRPAVGNVTMPGMMGTVTATAVTVTSAGALSTSPTTPNGNVVYMDGVSYNLTV